MARTKKFSKKLIIITLVVVLIVAGGVLFIFMHKTKETIHVTATGSHAKASSSSAKSSDKSVPASNSSSQQSSTAKSAPPASSTLMAPFGTFVSNHRPSLSGSSSPSGELSVCNTTPGASCYIEFTKGSTVKQLPSVTADSSGVASWSWDVKQAGFSSGSWQIKAVASLNGQTKSTMDSLTFEVQP